VKLTDTGEARVRGYLFVLERSLKTFLPSDVATDAVREIESHVRERIESATAAPNERQTIEQILAELGPPLRVAQAYSAERTLDEAVATGRFVPMVRAIWHLAVSTVGGFFAALGLFVGYVFGATFLALALLKPIFPDNVGLWVVNGPGSLPTSLGTKFTVPADQHVAGGYWIIPVCLFLGLFLLVLSHRSARGFLRWWRERHRS
jgi:uncharacterized membrane protein